MTDFSRVKELEPKEYFRILHHRLEVPVDLFSMTLGLAADTITEPLAQDFMADYLAGTGRTGGLIGMVRINERGDTLLLDAAVRYPI